MLRPATAADLAELNRVAFESKAGWGYSTVQVDAWRAELGTTLAALEARPTCVATCDGRVVAWAQVEPTGSPWSLEALWVAPSHQRRGLGRALLDWARERAAAAGEGVLAIDADPNAVGFYAACGAVVAGEVPAPIDGEPDRVRPQLRLATRVG